MNKKQIVETLYTLTLNHTKCGGQTVVAYLGFGNRYVFGFNRYQSHPLQKMYSKNPYGIFLHAEIDAIQKFLRSHVDIKRATMYICRMIYGIPAPSKPCEGCLRAIVAFNIKSVYHTTFGDSEYEKLF